ncbi:MAG: hypothetical protein KAT32_02225 [Candidatus Moranbacteria bacterium]|nr:hypothetical protein [Candidatus Moranbacteria bacterium]
MFSELSSFFDFFIRIFLIFGKVWFLILPTFSWFLFKNLWGRHAAIGWLMTQNDILLEIIPPQDVEKSPKIMEGFFNALAATDAGMNKFAQYALGKMNPYFSLELVGSEGAAHFYIRTPAFFRDLVESALYAQYQGVEIFQVDDYTGNIPALIPNDEWTLWGADWTLLKDDAYPIKTYKYFDEDVTGKMIDPLANYMEIISTLGPNQHLWLQYVVQPDRPQWFDEWGKTTVDEFLGKNNEKFGFFDRFFYDVKEIVKNIFPALFGPVEFSSLESPATDEQPLEFRLTPGEKQTLASLEENIAKSMFSVKARILCIGRKENFSMINVAGASAMLKEFSDNHTNQFIPVDRSKTYADYVNVDARKGSRMRRILERYRDRDDSGVTFHLSTTELATVFHLPDMSIVSPSVQFSSARRGGAPTNLPTT